MEKIVSQGIDLMLNHFGGLTVILLALTMVYAIYKSHVHRHLNWTDLVTAKGTNNVSLTKFLQLVGGVTGTWMVVYTTLHDKLTYDLLLVYLTYVGAIDGWSKFVSARYNPISQDKKEESVSPTPPKK